MNDLTNNFGTLYHPVKAFVVFTRRSAAHSNSIYIESYDMDAEGCPINGHPLSIKEGNELAKALTVAERRPQNFLQPSGLLPKNLLHLKIGADGFAIWHTRKQRVKLLFLDKLGIENGEAEIPALLWKASKNQLRLFAKVEETVTTDITLFHAPFFNTYDDGRVCMGNVQINIPKDCDLERFMGLWQDYFFNSYFSHLFEGHRPVRGNIVQLWQSLMNTNAPFPLDTLIPSKFRLKNLLS